MNIIQIAGFLGADVETRFTPSGQKVATMRVATTTKRAGKDETIWWRVTVWGDRFDKMMQYLKKGSSVIVVGELSKPEIYTDKEGNPQISMNITAEMIKFSPFGKPGERGPSVSSNEDETPVAAMQSQYSYGSNAAPKGGSSFDEDQLPF